MRNLKKNFYILVFALLAACSGNLHQLAHRENRLKLDGFYSSYLALEYLEYSRSLAANRNNRDAQYFAKKGLATADGYPVALESPLKWHAAMIEREDLITAQKRYEVIATDEVKHILPIQMAHLTFLYDCWVSGESKPAFRMGEMARCKDRFYVLLKEIEDFVANMHKGQPQTTIVENEVERFLVLFDFDKYYINEQAERKLVEILNAIDSIEGDYVLMLAGHADRMGKNLYNERLSQNRIKAVRNYLIANGVDRKFIEIRSMGEDYPDIITKDSRHKRLNRSTEVYIIKGARSVKNMPLPMLKNLIFKKEIAQIHEERGIK